MNVDTDRSRKLVMTNVMLITGMAVLGYFVAQNSLSGRWIISAVDLTMLAALCLVFLLQRRRVESRLPTYFGVAAFTVFLFYLLIFQEPLLHAYLWFFALPPLLLYLLGIRAGSFIFFVVFLGLAVIVTGTLPGIGSDYSTILTSTILLSLLANYVLSFFFEYTRDRTFQLLQARHRDLEASLEEVRTLSNELQESEALHRSLIEHAADGIVVLNGEKIVLANDRICTMLGFPKEEIVGESYVRHVDPAEQGRLASLYSERLRTGAAPELYETLLVHRDGFRIPVEISAGLIHFQRRIADFVVVRDISSRKRVEDELKYFAYHDPLTSLPNRKALFEEFFRMRERAGGGHASNALMYLDLDGFKRVNDELGHEAGDHVLSTVANRLRDSLRASDHVYRIGGDEFVILASRLQQPTDAASIAAKLIQSVSRPLEYGATPCEISASIGICLFEPESITSEELLRRADRAMFLAKQNRTGYAFSVE